MNDSSTQPARVHQSASEIQEHPHANSSFQEGLRLSTDLQEDGAGEPFGDAWLSAEMINLDWFDIEL